MLQILYPILILFSCSLFWSCSSPEEKVAAIRLNTLNDSVVKMADLKNSQASVLIFYAPYCPLSENYTLTVTRIRKQFKDQDIRFYGIVPSAFYSTEEIREFQESYPVNYPLLTDPENKLTHLLNATVTPEAVVFDSTLKVRYQGAIDNWYQELGVKREVISANYLIDALQAVIRGNKVDPEQTKPVGCLIE